MTTNNFSNFVDVEKLQYLQDTFSDATGLAAVTVDNNGKQVTKPSNFTDFCFNHIRQSNAGRRLCEKCDKEGTGAYKCHAGLMDFAEPIIINGEKIGKVLGGQVLFEEPDEAKFEQLATKLDLDKKSLLDALKKVSVRSEDSVKAAAKLLAEIITLFINSEYYIKHNDKKVALLETEVKNVLEDTNAISTHTEELRHISKRQNILALNASIEAGRAGEAGKGFSVVADQMGVLSKQSSDIYSSITTFAKNIDTSIHKLDNFFSNEIENEDII